MAPMRIDIHSHLMSVAFAEHLQGRDTLPATVHAADGYITHCTPRFSMHYGRPILSVEAKLADMDAAGIDLTVLSPAPPGPHVLGGAQADAWAVQRRGRRPAAPGYGPPGGILRPRGRRCSAQSRLHQGRRCQQFKLWLAWAARCLALGRDDPADRGQDGLPGLLAVGADVQLQHRVIGDDVFARARDTQWSRCRCS